MQTYNLPQWILFFFIYSFIGWVWESCYVSVRKKRWVNRGFMHGPMLPLYGSGALVILVSTIGVRDNPALVFFMGMAAATVLEYFTGAAMEKLFHVKYWDYSNQRLNLKGYICVTSSLCWGCFSVLLVRAVHVPIEDAVLKIPLIMAETLAVVLSVAAAVDFTESFNEAMDMKHILMQLEESREQIRKMQEKLKLASEDFREELREDYREYIERRNEKKLSRKAVYLERLDKMRAARKQQLVQLSERAELLFKEEIPAFKEGIPKKLDSLIGEERRRELSEIRKDIVREIQKMGARTDRNYLRVIKHLRRNPTAVSEKFKEALEELRQYMDTK